MTQPLMGPTLAILAIVLASIWICYYVARRRGAKVSFWVVMAAMFGPLAVPFVFFARPRPGSGSR